jgi:cytochrome b561
MSFNPGRSILSVAIFWLFVGFCVAAFALGWSLDHAPIDPAARDDLSDIHISLGLTAGLLLLADIIVGAGQYIYSGGGGEPGPGRELAGFWLRKLVYLTFLVMVGAAVLSAAYRGEPLYFWGYPLPAWDLGKHALAEPVEKAHFFAAYIFAGALLGYALFAIFDQLFPRTEAGLDFLPTSTTGLIAEGLARSFRFFGGAAFWLQLFLGVISTVLLGFGFAGRTVSPGETVFGDAIYWAAGALGMLILTTLFSFKYLKTAKRIRSDPTRYLSREYRWTFWFVVVGGLLSVLGLLDSFGGVGLSVGLLIGKTMSQPPGIAITDPTKIIRALDVFVLLVNFNLLFAHFIGFGVAAWLRISSLQARHQFLLVPLAIKPPPSREIETSA